MTTTPNHTPPVTAVPAGSQPFIARPEAAAAAAEGATLSTDMDYAEHERTYMTFTGMVKWGIIGAVVLVLFLFIAIHPIINAPAS